MSDVARICESTQRHGNALVLLLLLKTWDGDEPPTRDELANLAHISPRQAERDLLKLVEDGEVEKVGRRGQVTRFQIKGLTDVSDESDNALTNMTDEVQTDVSDPTPVLTDVSVESVISDIPLSVPSDTSVRPFDGTEVAPSEDIRTSTDTPQPTVEADADAPPPRKGRRAKKERPPPDPRREHPAIKLVKTLQERWPAKFLWDDLIELLGDEPDELRLTKCRKLWLKQTFNPNSTGWTDWYPAGVLEAKEAEYGRNGRPQAGAGGSQQNGGGGGTRRERNLAELRRQSEEVTFDWTPSAVDDKGAGYKARSH